MTDLKLTCYTTRTTALVWQNDRFVTQTTSHGTVQYNKFWNKIHGWFRSHFLHVKFKKNLNRKAKALTWPLNLKVVSILPVIFWRQQISWSYCAARRRFGLVAWRNKKKVTLSGKCRPAWGATVMCYGCYANGFRFDSHLADSLCFFFFAFFRFCLGVMFRG